MTDNTLTEAARVRDFWINDLGEAGWYAGTPEIDTRVRDGFLELWQEARDGGLGLWLTDPEGALAYLILTDQMPRNMFRGRAESFATDPLALAATREAVARDYDLKIEAPQRQFFYLPFEHSEDAADQDRAVELFRQRLPVPDSILHAEAHRHIIRHFGRFPTRNAALGRLSTPAEQRWLDSGGYGAVVQALIEDKSPDFPDS